MRRRGYTIVGLEQTDASKNLGAQETAQMLPPRCVLLLGKEKEGIPVPLLQVVDVCLEIPQYGVVRSLNVHVSAAIAIWELTKRNRSQLTAADTNDHRIK
jgi:tRNA guanosine-2'-O-methyltransferase